jgi:hypothetical protein
MGQPSQPNDTPAEKLLGVANELFMAAARGAIRAAATHVQAAVRRVDDRLSEVREAAKPPKLAARRRPKAKRVEVVDEPSGSQR